MDTQATFKALNEELKRRNAHRELVICGGAALVDLMIISRETHDIDVLRPQLDPDLQAAADAVGKKLNLREHWLNNGAQSLMSDLPLDWESNCQNLFTGSHLSVKSIGRRDLIYSKLYATADRMSDMGDLVKLRPSEQELSEAKQWLFEKDASDIWPQIVEECLSQLRKKLGYG